jgi:hypothetical protein
MNDKELLERALLEIQSLRRQNELMGARLSMFDAVMSALHGSPASEHRGALSPDIAWDIQKRITAMEKTVSPPESITFETQKSQ